ncbi:oxidoreductase [Verticillium alfalfae VaMs.102]|uniref:Oxidoreductase n=1 Tax=Verticillium alfalfae (strain VaMs.102 / ATCC MYA-4576 / FGSC 10136) TaxID=526221 RepID=C9SXD2_VERA1|nr:oxidoreductase [Verticillium alfalfae VaMs.102]EEY23322.1 oxidoreductase [Verticillium alfalfae VaMs.102]
MVSETDLHDYPSLFSLKGKVAVITGGSRGLGLHAASAILQAGASKVFISSRKAAACDSACKELNALPNLAPGAVAISAPADIATPEGVAFAAGDGQEAHAARRPAARQRRRDAVFGDDPRLPAAACRCARRATTPAASSSRRRSRPRRRLPSASRHLRLRGQQGRVIHLGRNLALELGGRGITVNSIAPGFFPSKMSNGLLDMAGGPEVVGKGNPMGRLGRPEDIAGAVVYLASRAGSHVNGETIAIDGGALWARASCT